MKNYLAIPRQVPEFVRAEFPTFVEFLRAYYKWYQQEYLADQSLEEIFDIDQAAAEFIQYFRKQLDIYGITLNFDDRRYIRHLKEMYNSKGSTLGIQFLLQLVYDQGSLVTTPWDSVMKPSTGAWNQQTSIVISDVIFHGHTIDEFSGSLISFQTAPDENLDRRSYETFVTEVLALPNDRYELFITKFPLSELLDTFTITLGEDIVTGSVYNTVTNVSVTAGGENFAIGQVFVIDPNLNSTFNAGDNTIEGEGIYIKVKDVDRKGAIKSVDLYQYGTDYTFDDIGQFTVAFLPSDAQFTSASQSFARKDTVEYSNCVAATTKSLAQYGVNVLSTSDLHTIYLDAPLTTIDGVTINKKWVVSYEVFNDEFDTITIPNHGFTTGDLISYKSTTNFVIAKDQLVGYTGSSAEAYLDNFMWYIIVKDKNTIQLAQTYDNAIAGTPIDFYCNTTDELTSYFYKGFDRILVKNEAPQNRNGIYQVSQDNQTLTRVLTPSVAENALSEVPIGLCDDVDPRTLEFNQFPSPFDLYGFTGSAAASSTITRDSTVISPAGGIPLKMVVTGNDAYTNSYNSSPWTFAPASSGQTWTVSVWMKSSVALTAGIFVFGADNSGVYVEGTNRMFSVTTDWVKYTTTVTLSNVNTTGLQVRLEGPDLNGSGKTVWYDDLRISLANGVSVTDNTIVLPSAHELETGAAITYTANGTAITTFDGDTDIDLVDGVYYIVKKTDTSFWLATSHDNAIARQILVLSGIGNPYQTFVVPGRTSTLATAKGSNVYVTGGDYYGNTHWTQIDYIAQLDNTSTIFGTEDFNVSVGFNKDSSVIWLAEDPTDFSKYFIGQRVSGQYIPAGATVTGWGHTTPNPTNGPATGPYIQLSVPVNVSNTVASAAVSIADNTINIVAHNFASGDAVIYNNGGGTSITYLSGSTTSLVSGGIYYAIKVDDNNIKLASTYSDATSIPPTPLDLNGTGNSNQTITAASYVYVKINFQGGNFFNRTRWRKSSDVARLTFTRGSMRNYVGTYTTNYNVLGDSVPLQDSYYYQRFSYVTSLEIPLKEYAGMLRSTMHPAGTKHFGNYNLSYQFAPTISAASELSLVLNKDSIRDYVYPSDSWRFSVTHIIDPFENNNIIPIQLEGDANRIMSLTRAATTIGSVTPYTLEGEDSRVMTLIRDKTTIGEVFVNPGDELWSANVYACPPVDSTSLQETSFTTAMDMVRNTTNLPEIGPTYNYISTSEAYTFNINKSGLSDSVATSTGSNSVAALWSSQYVVLFSLDSGSIYWESGYTDSTESSITN